MQLNGNDYAWMTGGKPSSPVCVLLVCVAGEAWECYTKLNSLPAIPELGGTLRGAAVAITHDAQRITR